MMKIVATNVVASRLPERRPTATPTLVPILSTVRAEVNRWTRDIIKPSHIYKGRFALPLNPKFWSQRRSEFVCRQTAKVGDLR